MSDQSGHRRDWLRFLVDGVVIVASILLAFAINAWWEGRKDRAKEQSYLRMLTSDAQQTLDNNAVFSGKADSVDWAGARLVRAYYVSVSPPADSIIKWLSFANGNWIVEPTLGTATTLISTGDLDLIRDEQIRTRITRYVTNMTAFDYFQRQGRDEFRSARDELSRYVDLDLLRLGTMSARARAAGVAGDSLFPFPSGDIRSQRQPDMQALVRNADVHRILEQMNRTKTNMRLQRTNMRFQTEKILKQLETGKATPGNTKSTS